MKSISKTSNLHRNGITRLDVVVIIFVLALLASMASPWILKLREQARQASRANNMRH